MKRALAAIGRLIGRSFGALATGFSTVGPREFALIAGLALVSYGASLIYWPAAFIAPGAVLLAVAIFGVH